MQIGWSYLNHVQQAGQYPFRDGVIIVLEPEIEIWRKHPKTLFDLMRKNPIHNRVEYVLGDMKSQKDLRDTDDGLAQNSLERFRAVGFHHCAWPLKSHRV